MVRKLWFHKVLALLLVTGCLWLGLTQVGGLVDERQQRQREAEQSVMGSLAGEQTLVGPVLLRSCTERWQRFEGEGKDRKAIDEDSHFLLSVWPQSVEVDGQATLEPRRRGIFEVNTYQTAMSLKLRFADLARLEPKARHDNGRVACHDATLGFGVNDARGLLEVAASEAGRALRVAPGSQLALMPTGFHVPIAMEGRAMTDPLAVDMKLVLAGSLSLSFVPVAQQTQVALRSNWPHPSFGGRFLPVGPREISSQGFQARWSVNALATTARQRVLGGEQACGAAPAAPTSCLDTFGVSFVAPINGYVLSDRALKYGMLFIGLTFAFVGLAELLKRARVHPVQYLLAGCALSVFFLLLLSLQEHLPFGLAYGIAATACTVLLAYHGRHCLGSWALGAGFGVAIAALYGSLYLLLQLEQTALAVGAVMLFGVLAAIIVVTRRVDWYSLTGSQGLQAGPPPAVPGFPDNGGPRAQGAMSPAA